MTSSIVRTNPTAGTATTSSVRENFGFAADEINRLLRANTDKQVTTGVNALSAVFSSVPTFTLTDGVRVLLEIGSANTTATPTLNVNFSGNVPIKKNDNTDLAIGDLVAGGYYEFVYSSLNNYWLMLNAAQLNSSLHSPGFTGTPTAPTAVAGTDTAQLATTEFVQEATPNASATVSGIIELATSSEVIGGVDATKALTAANLLRVAVSNNQVASDGDQGSIEIAGVILKWGQFDIPSGLTQTITFDEPFPNFCSVAITQREATNPQSVVGVVAGSRTAASFQVDTNGFSATIYWICIGG